MSQVETINPVTAKSSMTPFDFTTMEEEDIKPDMSNWGLSALSTILPKVPPSEWFNVSSPGVASDYFAAPLSQQSLERDAQTPGHPLNSALTPSFWLFQNPSASESSGSSSTPNSAGGNGSTSSQPSPFVVGQDLSYGSSAQAGPGPSSQFSSSRVPMFDRPNAIPTSLLVSPPKQHNTPLISTPNLSLTGNTSVDSPESYDELATTSEERAKHKPAIHYTPVKTEGHGRASKRRGSSLSSLDDHDDLDNGDEQDHDSYEIHEGVERDGMIWGMKVEDYRALSARERKRVRNRISARTFRAKRKEHLSSLETDLSAKDLKIKHAQDEAAKLRRQVADLKKRLAKYEAV